MKIIWLCNIRFSNQPLKATGTWLQPLAEMVNRTENYRVVNVNFCQESNIKSEEVNGIKQYLLPLGKKSIVARFSHKRHLQDIGEELKKVLDKEKPDIVQIWGTEGHWCTLFCMGYIQVPAFVEMQGVMRTCYDSFYGGLTNKNILKCILVPQSVYKFPRYTIWWKRREMLLRSKEEAKTIKNFSIVSVQSRWVEGYVRSINPKVSILHTTIILREPFYHCKLWQFREVGTSPLIFTSSSTNSSLKGLDILIRALAELKHRYPNLRLNIAGSIIGRHGRFWESGYTRFTLSLINKLGLTKNVFFIGPLNDYQIIEQLQQCNVCVVPSFVESYSLALAEAMMVGVPCVVSYAGAMPELANDKQEALFYNSKDFVSCAERIADCLSNPYLAKKLSYNAHVRKMKDCDKSQLLKTQLENYNKILEKKSCYESK